MSYRSRILSTCSNYGNLVYFQLICLFSHNLIYPDKFCNILLNDGRVSKNVDRFDSIFRGYISLSSNLEYTGAKE